MPQIIGGCMPQTGATAPPAASAGRSFLGPAACLQRRGTSGCVWVCVYVGGGEGGRRGTEQSGLTVLEWSGEATNSSGSNRSGMHIGRPPPPTPPPPSPAPPRASGSVTSPVMRWYMSSTSPISVSKCEVAS